MNSRKASPLKPTLIALAGLLAAVMHVAAQTQFTETWESYTSGATPYGSWQLQTGTWGSIATPGADGNGQRYAVAAGQLARIQRPVDLDTHTHVVLQGWLLDSSGNNRSVLGLGRTVTANDTTLIRMGAGGAAAYTIQYYDPAISAGVITVDTGLPVEAGWHFLRLDLTCDGNASNLWNITWRIWNVTQTVEKLGAFDWHFDRTNCNYVTLGAAATTPGAVAWDDIKVGSLADVGPPPSINLGPWQVVLTVRASSEIPGWPATNAIDGNAGSVWSSTSHGAVSNATEWLAVDLGQVMPVTGVSITPRSGGWGFPVDYRIDYSTDSVIWTTVPGTIFTNQPVATSVVSLTFTNPVLARAVRIYATKLSTDGFNHYLQIAEFKTLGAEPWASPAELRGKKVIGAGQYTALNLHDPFTPTPKYLADNPDYLENHPFDGVSIPVKVDSQWATNQGLITELSYPLHTLTMTRLAIPYSAVQSAVADLNRVSWGHVTDNFLWYGVWDGTRGGDFDTRYPVDPASSNDWVIVTQNAALCARICREAGLKGFMMDTEQYSNYDSSEPYPFGKGTPEVWRERGQQWIQAVQAEFPAIKIILFFSWGPETQPGGWTGYENLRHFMNGILDGVQSPARLIHGWENTFWYGGTRVLPGNVTTKYPGDRAAYSQARNDIKNVWRNYSDNPAKYDQFVEAGMAAWVESDPYNLTPGFPSGYQIELPWSNLPYTLAYSDSYVWVWSQHASYPQTKDVLNPFLASIANRTFNTGQEQMAFTENFQTDPLQRGWYFDFDMLGIGRALNEGFLPVMNPDSISYNWDSTNQAVRVCGTWITGLFGETVDIPGWQRRRYVHPLQPLTRSNSFHVEFDFKVENFGSDLTNPILIGLFNSDSLVTTQSITLRIDSPTAAKLTVAGDGLPWINNLSLSNNLTTTKTYRISFSHNGSTGAFQAMLTDTADSSLIAQVGGTVPGNVGQFQLDEAGIAQLDATFTSTPLAQAHHYLLKHAALFPPAAVLSFVTSQPLTGIGLQLALQGLPGQTYQIESSTNLLNWSSVGSVVASNAPVPFLDAGATNHTRRFYRAYE